MNIELFAHESVNNAHQLNTSDLHVLPNDQGYGIYYRLSGQLIKKYDLSPEDGVRFITYFKFLANMDVGEKRRPQSGALLFPLAETAIDLRLSTIANYLGQESLVIRLLAEDYMEKSQVQVFFEHEWNQIKRLIRYKSGLILFSGPVDSGKTTAMYHLVKNRLESQQQQVISIEDPVEIKEKSFLQVQVNEKSGVTYEQLLKASLRHHPDIILVGEIRDEETAKMVIRGALTGHLILATVHAKDAAGVLTRLEELGISSELLQQTIIGIIFQKLLPIYCPLCQSNCHILCDHYYNRSKRAALCEVWDRVKINEFYHPLKQKSSINRSFNHLLKKVYSYGFISQDVYEQYYIP
ncbi:competence type IV pilus ATPase ComGA [Allofustis seminis]|uniref:competence type IV pilus ATPase ComGA n=1 Tax=Allofustis seminis TaxID=166939 RepID=UPI00036413EE|nr:competence type IV pilus ATPase ComGA [Allofustis seminis]